MTTYTLSGGATYFSPTSSTVIGYADDVELEIVMPDGDTSFEFDVNYFLITVELVANSFDIRIDGRSLESGFAPTITAVVSAQWLDLGGLTQNSTLLTVGFTTTDIPDVGPVKIEYNFNVDGAPLTSYTSTAGAQHFQNNVISAAVHTSFPMDTPLSLLQLNPTVSEDDYLSGIDFGGSPLNVGLGNDVVLGSSGADIIEGDAGNDHLTGNGGNDRLEGGDGADTLNGGAGHDTLIGGDSSADLRDVIYGGAGNDSADGGYGNDLIYGMDGNDTLSGGFGADELLGQDGNDVITGNAYSDLIFGGAGDDFINGGFGHDRLNGGTGADKFYHIGVEGHGADWVQDYNAAESDVLLFGNATAAVDDFQINFSATDGAGSADVAEAFVIYRPTEQILWALVDGADQDQINLKLGGEVFDLLA